MPQWSSRNWILHGVALGALLSVVSAESALAQTATPSAQPDGATTGQGVAEIVVTATKRTGSVENIPSSITALSADDLKLRSISDVRNLAAQVPGLAFQQLTTATFITIRGIGASVDNGLTQPSVATYIDGVLLPRSTMALIRSVDLERMEVLRGPQGTIYGRNTSGGAIDFISVKPTQDFALGMTAGIGNYDARNVSGYVSGPIAPGITARVSASREVADGYYKNILTGGNALNTNFWSVRGALRIEPVDNLTIDMSAQYQKQRSRLGIQQSLVITNPALYPPGTVITTKPWQVANDFPADGYSNTAVYSLVANWKVDDHLTLRSTTGYVDHRSNFELDADGTSHPLYNLIRFPRPSKSFQQELDLIVDAGPLKFLAGAYYFKEHFSARQDNQFPTGLGGALPAGLTTTAGSDEHIRSYAFFTDGSLKLLPKLRLNFGFRYNNERDRSVAFAGVFTSAPTENIEPGVNFAGASGQVSRISSSKFLPKIGFDYDVAPNILFYAQFQKGFKSGGFNINPIGQKFLPEKLDAYEAGVKSHFFNHKLVINAAAYHYVYKDLQALIVQTGQTTASVQNGDARINGGELEVSARPNTWLDFNLGVGVTDAKYTKFVSRDDFNSAAGFQDLAGNRLSRVPAYTINAGVNVTIPTEFGPFAKTVLRGEVIQTGKTYFRPFNLRQDLQRPYATVNGSLTFRSADDSGFTAQIFVRNLTNKASLQSVNYAGVLGEFFGVYNPPRMYGASIGFKL